MNGLPPPAPAAPIDARARKFPCPQCGADTAWHPGAARLRCIYCGFEQDVAAGEAPQAVAERALDGELRAPEKLGWGVERKRYRCARCGAVETLEPGMRAFSCAFCGTPGVVEVPPDAELVPYDPSYLAGFLAEEYGVPLDRAWAAARERMTATLRAACRAEVPGDLCRNLQVETSWSDLACKSGLLPIWIAAYQYRGRTYRYAVNGATGRATGSAPWSWIKIGLAALVVLALALFVLSR